MSTPENVALPITLMNSIMEYLGDQPYKDVANLITAIEQNAQTVALDSVPDMEENRDIEGEDNE